MNVPFTYLIGWTTLNVYYYGCRTAKKCNPDELWTTYFTSSKYVASFRKEHGEPDLIQVRKTFTKKEDATLFESKVLRRMRVVSSNMFLNQHSPSEGFVTSGKTHAMLVDGTRLGLVDVADPRWDTGEIISTIPKRTQLQKNMALAKDPSTGEILGRISTVDPRWKTGEIVGIRKGSTGSDKQRTSASDTAKKVNKGMMLCVSKITGDAIRVPSEIYHQLKDVLLVSGQRGTKSNSGVGRGNMSAFDVETKTWKTISTIEYSSNKHKYLTPNSKKLKELYDPN